MGRRVTSMLLVALRHLTLFSNTSMNNGDTARMDHRFAHPAMVFPLWIALRGMRTVGTAQRL
jgi:hypothetical protein